MKTFFDFYQEQNRKKQKTRTKAPVFFDGIMDEILKQDLQNARELKE
ncbi:MAG: hypothetical protein OIF50_09465 [Flavobacteriaceae bacterium]|nr:hypothetical protein [Flavobacteriaceae bacterium]